MRNLGGVKLEAEKGRGSEVFGVRQEVAAMDTAADLHIPAALNIFWGLTIGIVGVGLLPLGPVSEFVLNLSRRGKLNLATTSANSPRFTVPQRWFGHFYVLGTLMNTTLLVISFLFAYHCTFPIQTHDSQVSTIVGSLGGASSQHLDGGVGNVGDLAIYRGRAWETVLLLVMLELQLLRRLHESINLFQYSPLARMHIVGYLIGMGYYLAVSLTLFSLHFQDQKYVKMLCTFVVRRLGRAWVLHTGPPLLNAEIAWKHYLKTLPHFEWYQYVGMAVFALGWIQQYRCHAILASIRSKKPNTGSKAVVKPYSMDKKKIDRYEIPRGSWFEWVSSAHYFAEIVIYAGILIVSRGTNIQIWLLFIWVVLNLTLIATETHQWYKSKFDDYPKLRRAIIPFIY